MAFGILKRYDKCACGCGAKLPQTTYYGKMRVLYGMYPRFIVGHATRHPDIKVLIKGRPNVIKQWLLDNEGKFKCQCGCGRRIKLQGEYHSKGVPQYSQGHHPNSSVQVARSGNDLVENKTRRKFLLSERVEVLVKYDYSCAKCGWGGKENVQHLEFDHIIPIAKGGLTCADNCQPLCWTCHQSKTMNDTVNHRVHLAGRGFRGGE